MQLGVPRNFVYATNPTNVPGMPIKSYANQKGDAHSGLCSAEMCDMVAAYKAQRKQPASEPWVLILDGDRTHHSAEFNTWCEANNVEKIKLPPRSHDLSPPDSHLFAAAKRRFASTLRHGRFPSWAERARRLHKVLEEESPDAHIEDYKLRVLACISADGDRFERQLKELKVVAKAAEPRKGRKRVHT
jgi:hypothetical protein